MLLTFSRLKMFFFMALSVKVEKKCVTVFDADKMFMFDTDKHYFASKLTTDMLVYHMTVKLFSEITHVIKII